MAAPAFGLAGTPITGTGAITVAWPAGHASGDIGLLVVQSSNEAISLSTPSGFVEVTNSPQGVGTAATLGSTRIAMFWCRAVSGAMADVVVADPGDHARGQIYTFTGCIATGNPWDVTSGSTEAVASTAMSTPGFTTTVAETRVVVIFGHAIDAAGVGQVSLEANASLTGGAEHTDGCTTNGTGGGWAVWSAQKAVAGVVGASTATLASSTAHACISIALKPPAAVPQQTMTGLLASSCILAAQGVFSQAQTMVGILATVAISAAQGTFVSEEIPEEVDVQRPQVVRRHRRITRLFGRFARFK